MFLTEYIGNSTVVWVLLRSIKLKTMADVCLLNLALSDLIFAASLPLWSFNSQSLVLCKVMTAIYQVGIFSIPITDKLLRKKKMVFFLLYLFLSSSHSWGFTVGLYL